MYRSMKRRDIEARRQAALQHGSARPHPLRPSRVAVTLMHGVAADPALLDGMKYILVAREGHLGELIVFPKTYVHLDMAWRLAPSLNAVVSAGFVSSIHGHVSCWGRSESIEYARKTPCQSHPDDTALLNGLLASMDSSSLS